MERLVYLDNAATTFPKPNGVLKTLTKTVKHHCGNPGRSSHRLSLAASDIICECRTKIANLFNSEEECVVFTSSATHSINLAIKASLHKNAHVLISDIEHNAVLRPIYSLAKKGVITYDVYKTHASASKTIEEITKLTKPQTSLLCACHHSNICNIVLPIHQIGAYCKENKIDFLVDASQSCGTIKIDIKDDFIDFLCAPAHKGLYGLPGLGFVVFSEKFNENKAKTLNTFIEGGNGIRSIDPFMPDFLPERFESGTLSAPLIAALSNGISFINSRSQTAICKKETALAAKLKAILQKNPKITFYGPDIPGGILLFNVKDIPSEQVASVLDSHGICVRAGLHCAPLAHKKIKTPLDGAIRVSFGAFNEISDVLYFENVIAKNF